MQSKSIKIIVAFILMHSYCHASDEYSPELRIVNFEHLNRTAFLKPYPPQKSDSTLLVQYSSDYNFEGVKHMAAYALRRRYKDVRLRIKDGTPLSDVFKKFQENMKPTIYFELRDTQ
jgi:hypothetical protein